MARAAEHLVLISAGVDPLGVIVVEAGHLDRPGYQAGLTAYAEGTVRGVAAGSSVALRQSAGARSCSPAVTAKPTRT